jgi:hypothetical protein
MSVLKLPLRINSSGALERSPTYDDYIQTRLRIFILSGTGKYLLLPSPGISALWLKLTTIGPTSKFCYKDVLPENERRNIEDIIRKEANLWLEMGLDDYSDMIEEVKILGDETNANGIVFRTKEFEFAYFFEFAMPGKGLNRTAVGNWNIKELINAIR